MDSTDPNMLLIRRAVVMLSMGEQPPESMNVLALIDRGYAETRPYSEEGGYPGLVLTEMGREAAARWRRGDNRGADD